MIKKFSQLLIIIIFSTTPTFAMKSNSDEDPTSVSKMKHSFEVLALEELEEDGYSTTIQSGTMKDDEPSKRNFRAAACMGGSLISGLVVGVIEAAVLTAVTGEFDPIISTTCVLLTPLAFGIATLTCAFTPGPFDI